MTSQFQTEQEFFWAGEFGDQYIERNQGQQIIAANLSLFGRVLERTVSVRSAIEFGANIGLNLEALRMLCPGIELSAIEINQRAAGVLEKRGNVKVYAQSILEFQPDYPRDMVLIKGVLIHLNPDCLPKVYDLLHSTSKRYICIAEYYNPVPVEIPYRGNTGKLFKRDFAGEMLDRFPNVRLVDYGFLYRRDNNFAQDDITWFLLEKKET